MTLEELDRYMATVSLANAWRMAAGLFLGIAFSLALRLVIEGLERRQSSLVCGLLALQVVLAGSAAFVSKRAFDAAHELRGRARRRGAS